MIPLVAALGMSAATSGGLGRAARDAIFADLRDGLIVLSSTGVIVDLNPTAERMLGCTAADTIGRTAGEVFVGRLSQLGDVAGGDGLPVDIMLPASPAPRVYAVRCLPVNDAVDGESGQILVLRDVTAYKRAETLLQATFLANASATLASTLDYDITLQQVARLAVPALGDWCTVYMVEDDGVVRRVAVAYADGEKAELAAALRRYPPSPVSPQSTVGQVMRTGEPSITPSIPDTYVASIAQDAEHLEIMRRLDFRTSMTVPLEARGVVFGALALFSSDPHRHYDGADFALATDLAQRAGLAVDNARLYREAQRAIRSRDEFLSVAAHELKTPMTSLLGFTQMLLRSLGTDRAAPDRLIERSLLAIQSQSERLSRLVTRLLDIARIEGGRLAIEATPTDLVPLVFSVIESIRMSKPSCNIQVQTPETLTATVDPVRFEQVLTNLLDNAARFSPDGAPIDVDLSLIPPGSVRLTVTDQGIGVPVEHRDRIFSRFFQAQTGQHVTGMGLGLFICREIVEQHGGFIVVEEPEAGGARFVVSLPVGTVASRQQSPK